jgi:hypothetical protein
MKIETKYNINDKVFFLDGEIVMSSDIIEIIITVDIQNIIEVQYSCFHKYKEKPNYYFNLKESKVFKTKEQLLASL